MHWKRGGLQAVVKRQRCRAQAISVYGVEQGMKRQIFSFPHSLAFFPVFVALMASTGISAQNTLPCKYEITAILGGPFCPQFGNAPVYARGLSNHDPPWVVGFYPECVIGPFKAFVWTGVGGGAIQPLTFPGGNIETSFAYDVTDTGLVVGAFAQPSQPTRGFIYDVSSGSWTQVDPVIPAGGCVIRAANNAGMVVGNRTISQTAYNAFIYHNGVYTDLGVMNGPFSEAMDVSETSAVVGWCGNSSSSNNARAFLHTSGRTILIDPPPNGISVAGTYVNDKLQVGLHCRIPDPQGGGTVARAAIWHDGLYELLPPLAGYRTSFIRGITSDGIIVGTSGAPVNGQTEFVACVWINGQAFDVRDLVNSSTQIAIGGAVALNNLGQVVCDAENSVSQVASLLTPISKPLGDINSDCFVNVDDLWVLIAHWGQTDSPADLNNDQLVNVLDLLIVIENWTFK